jgi:tryptophan synthase beta subunit
LLSGAKEENGEETMRKFVILGAALALGLVTAPVLPVHAQSAAAKSPYCNIGFKKWSTNWAEYYHCFGPMPRPERVRQVQEPAKSPYCNIGFKKWSTNWAEYYHCFGPKPRPEPVRQVREPAKSPFCNIGFKKWSTNWAEYYHCFGRS